MNNPLGNYDPGDLYDEDPGARRRRRLHLDPGEIDDAWAAAEEDDLPDNQVEIEDLAVGYIDEEAERREALMRTSDLTPRDSADLGPLPESAKRLAQRPLAPRSVRIRERYDRSAAYAESPSYHRSRQNPVDRALSRLSGDGYTVPDDLPAGRETHRAGLLGHLPFWGILILVILAFTALLVVALAIGSVIALL